MCLLKHEERPIVVRTGSTFEHHEPKVRYYSPRHVAGIFPLSVRVVLKLGTHKVTARRF